MLFSPADGISASLRLANAEDRRSDLTFVAEVATLAEQVAPRLAAGSFTFQARNNRKKAIGCQP
jgi:hypothetical protein